MKVHVLIYDNFAQFESIMTTHFMKFLNADIVTVGLNNNLVTSFEGYQMKPHKSLSEIKTDEVELFFVPGGDPTVLYPHDELYTFLSQLDPKKTMIAGICAGVYHLAKAGVIGSNKFTANSPLSKCEYLNPTHFIDKSVVIDGNIITARPEAYVDLGIAIAKHYDLFKDESDLKETIQFYRNFLD